MSLHDWFAGMALAAIIQTGIEGSVKDAAKRLGIPEDSYRAAVHWPRLCALEAYEMADAMLKEKERNP